MSDEHNPGYGHEPTHTTPEHHHEHHHQPPAPEQSAHLPSDAEVGSLISMVQSFAASYQSHRLEMQTLQSRLAIAEARAQSAEQLLRKLYSATIGYFGADGKPLADAQPLAEAQPITGEQPAPEHQGYEQQQAA